MQISENGINFIKEFEGCDLKAYRNAGERYYTVGFGHYGADVRQGQTITYAEADRLLREDLKNDYVPYIERYRQQGIITFDLTQNQVDALASFAYNNGVGEGGLKTLVRGRDKMTVANKMLEYYHSGSPIHDEGLKRRRRAERELFLNGNSATVQCNNTNPPDTRVKELQHLCNVIIGANIAEDNIWGNQTDNAVRQLPLCGIPYTQRELTIWIQSRLGCTPDGIFLYETANAVKQWQRSHNLVVDGIVGYNSYKSLALD